MGNEESRTKQSNYNPPPKAERSKSQAVIDKQQQMIEDLKAQNQLMLNLLGGVMNQLEFTKDDKKVIEIEGKRYDIKEKLGQGSFGTVFKAECNGKTYAIKEIKVTEDNESSIFII